MFDDELEDDFRDEILDLLKDDEMQHELEEIKLKLANENYNVLADNGMDVPGMIRQGIDIVPVIGTLKEMLVLFQDVEEYEKCANIVKWLKELE